MQGLRWFALLVTKPSSISSTKVLPGVIPEPRAKSSPLSTAGCGPSALPQMSGRCFSGRCFGPTDKEKRFLILASRCLLIAWING